MALECIRIEEILLLLCISTTLYFLFTKFIYIFIFVISCFWLSCQLISWSSSAFITQLFQQVNWIPHCLHQYGHLPEQHPLATQLDGRHWRLLRITVRTFWNRDAFERLSRKLAHHSFEKLAPFLSFLTLLRLKVNEWVKFPNEWWANWDWTSQEAPTYIVFADILTEFILLGLFGQSNDSQHNDAEDKHQRQSLHLFLSS